MRADYLRLLASGGECYLWVSDQYVKTIMGMFCESRMQQHCPALIGEWGKLLEQGVWQKAVAQYLQTLIGAADIVGIRLQGADSPLVQ